MEIQTQNQTLFRALLSFVRPQYRVAERLDISTASLSRHADSLLKRPSVLKRAAAFFSSTLPGEAVVDTDLLGTSISPADLVRLARTLRIESLKAW